MIRRLALLGTGLALISAAADAEPVPVELRQADEGWQLFRGGEPYLIRGAGGTAPLEDLAALGAKYIEAKRWDDAARVAERMIDLYPDDVTATGGLALMAQARSAFSKAAALDASNEHAVHWSLHLKDPSPGGGSR